MRIHGISAALVLVVVASGHSSASKEASKKDAARPSYCGRGNLVPFCAKGSQKQVESDLRKAFLPRKDKKANAKTYGLGPGQGIFLEGDGLEGRHFSLEKSGTQPPFPPQPNMVFTDADDCPAPPLRIRIEHCEAGTTALSCVVEPLDGRQICGSNPLPKLRGVSIVKGYWNAAGDWQEDAKVVTLSCDAEGSPEEKQELWADGAISRCVRHDYVPLDQNQLLTACVRMLRADYCGTGQAHTFIATNIDVHDKRHKVNAADCADGRCFEASWTEKGATCVGHTRWTGAGLDFEGTVCRKDYTLSPSGFLCRGTGTLSADALFSRSKVNTCGQEAPNCEHADSSPGCPPHLDKVAPKH